MTLDWPAHKRWICTECGHVGLKHEFDVVLDPKVAGNSWTVCPQCRAADHVTDVCDEPGCNEQASCGWNSPGGYRRTCFDHSQFKARV